MDTIIGIVAVFLVFGVLIIIVPVVGSVLFAIVQLIRIPFAFWLNTRERSAKYTKNNRGYSSPSVDAAHGYVQPVKEHPVTASTYDIYSSHDPDDEVTGEYHCQGWGHAISKKEFMRNNGYSDEYVDCVLNDD